MANTDITEGFYVHSDDVFLMDSDSYVGGQHSASMNKDEKNATKSSQVLRNATGDRQDGHTPTPCDAVQEMGYTNSQCPGQGGTGSGWQGGLFLSSASTPRSVETESTPVKRIPDYLGLSIFTTLFFFLPIGIFALIYSLKARALKRSSHYTKAADKATQALHLNILAIVVGVICYATTGFMMWYNIKRMEKLTNP